MNTYQGSCHCGAVAYQVEADITEAIRCNCSHCRRKGFVLTFVAPEQFTLLQGDTIQTVYQFNKKHIDHLFCPTCGVESYAYGHDGNGHYMYAINLNCVEDFDIDSIEVREFDGKSL